MTAEINQKLPGAYLEIDKATKENGFLMPSEKLTGSLLRTLATAKPAGKFLQLGTGTGLSTSWILDGMDQDSRLTSIDHDEPNLGVAKKFLGADQRLQVVLFDAEIWLEEHRGQKFDFIFADTWTGKYLLLDDVLEMLNPGGLYLVDDLLPQPNWPEGHREKVLKFVYDLERRSDVHLTKLDWATGIIIAVKK